MLEGATAVPFYRAATGVPGHFLAPCYCVAGWGFRRGMAARFGCFAFLGLLISTRISGGPTRSRCWADGGRGGGPRIAGPGVFQWGRGQLDSRGLWGVGVWGFSLPCLGGAVQGSVSPTLGGGFRGSEVRAIPLGFCILRGGAPVPAFCIRGGLAFGSGPPPGWTPGIPTAFGGGGLGLVLPSGVCGGGGPESGRAGGLCWSGGLDSFYLLPARTHSPPNRSCTPPPSTITHSHALHYPLSHTSPHILLAPPLYCFSTPHPIPHTPKAPFDRLP